MIQAMQAERRECSRLKSRLAVRIQDLAVTTTNISESGLQVSCPVIMAGKFIRSLEEQVVPITMSFPDGIAVAVTCSVSYLEDYGDEYLAGLRFEEFQSGGFAVLEQKCRYYRELEAGAA